MKVEFESALVWATLGQQRQLEMHPTEQLLSQARPIPLAQPVQLTSQPAKLNLLKLTLLVWRPSLASSRQSCLVPSRGYNNNKTQQAKRSL